MIDGEVVSASNLGSVHTCIYKSPLGSRGADGIARGRGRCRFVVVLVFASTARSMRRSDRACGSICIGIVLDVGMGAALLAVRR